MKAQTLIKKLNTLPGFKLGFWEKYGIKRVYLNQVQGCSTSAYLNVDENDELVSMGKYLSPLTLSELISLAQAVDENNKAVVDEKEDKIAKYDNWEYLGNGRIRTIYYSNGKEDFQIEGEICQADLDDFWG